MAAIDVETVCAVESCRHFNKICAEGHSLSPWHSRITVIGVYSEGIRRVFRSLPEFRTYLSNDLAAYGFVGHNFKFDILHLRTHGVDIPDSKFVGCTQLMAYILTDKIPDQWLADYEFRRQQQTGTHRKGSKHGLKTLAPFFLGVPEFWEAEDMDNDDYVTKDAEYSYRLYSVLKKKLDDRGEFAFYHDRLLPYTKLLLQAEQRGVEIDLQALREKEWDLGVTAQRLKEKLDEQWAAAHDFYRQTWLANCHWKYAEMARAAGTTLATSARYNKLLAAAATKAPKGFEYDSPLQMKWLLKDYLGYNVESFEGDETTGREVLERLSDEGKQDVRTFLEWRKVNKLLTAFLPTYKELAVDGVLHPIYNPSNTRTGRTSSERANLQQVPPELRPLIKARQGYRFVGYDAGAIEAKLIAYYSEDTVLYNILDKGISLHDHNVKVFFNLDTPYAQVAELYPVHRKATKNVSFALFYHAGAKRIQATFAQKGFHFSRQECNQMLSRFKNEYAAAMAFSDSISDLMEEGKVVENILGRPLRIENPDDAHMRAFNALIQSSASDLNLEAAYQAQRRYQAEGLDAHVILFVHDFISVEALEKDVPRAEAILIEEMTCFKLNTKNGPIALTVDGGVDERWAS